MTLPVDYSGRTIGSSVVLRRSVTPGKWVAQCACGRETTRTKGAVLLAIREDRSIVCNVCLSAIRSRTRRASMARGTARGAVARERNRATTPKEPRL